MTPTWPALPLLLALALPVQAGMDHSEYDVPPADLTEEEAAALRARIAEEIAADRARAEAERLAARPLGERLVEARCATCHRQDTYERANLGWLGWQTTVWRMDLVNGAGLERGDHGVMVDWLHSQYPPDGARSALEWLVLLAAVLALPLPLVFWRWRRRSRMN